MHELSMAASIMENVLAFAEDHHLGRVLQVRLAVGELTSIQPEELKFCYKSVTRETALRNSTLEIEDVMDVPVQVLQDSRSRALESIVGD